MHGVAVWNNNVAQRSTNKRAVCNKSKTAFRQSTVRKDHKVGEEGVFVNNLGVKPTLGF
jgi:hypothetical protein